MQCSLCEQNFFFPRPIANEHTDSGCWQHVDVGCIAIIARYLYFLHIEGVTTHWSVPVLIVYNHMLMELFHLIHQAIASGK